MSRELIALLEALRLEQLEKGSLDVAAEILSLILNICHETHKKHGVDCPCYQDGQEDMRYQKEVAGRRVLIGGEVQKFHELER